jgi:hypothetical protein
VLITSRNRTWSGVARQLDLEVFSRAESVAFLCKRSGRKEPEAAGELARELGDLPLALAQAAAYIDARAMTISDYLSLYRDPALARRLRDEGLESSEYPASVARTWLLTFQRLAGASPAAIELLRLCAFLDPDDIDLDLFTAGRTHAGKHLATMLDDRLKRIETAGVLAATSLVTVPAEGHLRVHRLVQAATRDQLNGDEIARWAARVLNLVDANFPNDPDDHRSWRVCATLAPHVEAVARHAESYRDLARTVGSLLLALGEYLWASAQLIAARTTLQHAVAINQEAYGPDHPEVAITLGTLGAVQLDLGELADARTTL